MSSSSRDFAPRHTSDGQRSVLFGRLRENMVLKGVALISAIALNVYVQTEHNPNPQETVQIQADLIAIAKPASLEIDPADMQFAVKVSGPRILVENLKDGDIHADVDLSNVPIDSGKTPPLIPKYLIPTLKPDAMQQVHIDWPNTLRVQVYEITSKSVEVHLPTLTSPAGSHYGRPLFDHTSVRCSGHEESVDKVKRVVVDLTPAPDGHIDGMFHVAAVDKNDNLISDVTLTPADVHVHIPIIQDPPMRYIYVSPNVTSEPLPPYRIEAMSVDPIRVKVVGKPGQIDLIPSIDTEGIALRDATQDVTLDVNLLPPPNVTVYTLQGHALTHVKVQFKIGKPVTPQSVPAPAPNDQTTTPSSNP